MSVHKSLCEVCLIHEAAISTVYFTDGTPAHKSSCPACGRYALGIGNSDDLVHFSATDRRALIGGIRHEHLRTGRDVWIRNAKEFISAIRAPKGLFEQLDYLIEHLTARSAYFQDRVPLDPNVDFPVTYSLTPEEALGVCRLGQELSLITHAGSSKEGTRWQLTANGWKHAQELRSMKPKSDQAFVAMWFGDEVASAFTDGILPALLECGYRPVRIDQQEHNGRIDDRIIVEIRRSSLLVADFTGQRNGVYFEAGFAYGLGIPVIWTVRKDDVHNLHFDTRSYNHILWESADNLRLKRKNRILATIPSGATV